MCAAAVALGLCSAGPAWADEKGKKDSDKGREDRKVIVIQLDLSKAPAGLVKQLVDLARSAGKDDDKQPEVTGSTGRLSILSGSAGKDDDKKKSGKKDDRKKKDSGKGDEDKKRAGDKKPNLVQVDLNKLPPDLARRLRAELAKGKGREDGKKASQKDDEDDDEKKKRGKKDDEDDDKDAKGKGKKDDGRKGGKKKDD